MWYMIQACVHVLIKGVPQRVIENFLKGQGINLVLGFVTKDKMAGWVSADEEKKISDWVEKIQEKFPYAWVDNVTIEVMGKGKVFLQVSDFLWKNKAFRSFLSRTKITTASRFHQLDRDTHFIILDASHVEKIEKFLSTRAEKCE